MRLARLAAVALLIIAVINLHAVGAIWLSKTGLGAFSSSHPFALVVIGLLVILAMFAVKHLLRFGHHREQKQPVLQNPNDTGRH